MVLNLINKALRFGEGKKLKKLQEKVIAAASWESEITKLTDEQLKAKTPEFKERLQGGETPDDILPEAYAVVREVAKRTLSMRHFDVQLMGGVVLHEGKIAEMATGEGKTLVATLPAYLNALEGKGVHIITVNDYLAKRDTQWMGPIYDFLGVTVGVLQHEEAHLYDSAYSSSEEKLKKLRPVSRREAYEADITYGTNNEFGFDYLRDNMAVSLEEMVQPGHNFAIVDEVDSILVDEARTPLIISGPSEKAADVYYAFAKIAPTLKAGKDYEVDEKTRTVAITEEGVTKVEKALGIENLYGSVHSQLVNHLIQALRAHVLYKKDVDYIVKDGEVVIVDEFTGRLMQGRRYSEGLHQAIEAKEKVSIKEENQTLATITLQNYFRLYDKLAGMTGTAATEADEFMHIYGLEVVIIPPNQPLVRKTLPDAIYKNEDLKFKAVTEDIVERYRRGQPVLVGTISIEKSEKLSRMLKKRGVPHQVLNAKYHEMEAEIVAQAGKKGAITIATNMAGRGTDIVLGGNRPEPVEAKEVVGFGGLHVLGTERHESRRIDNQLRGRSGRQGDPGSSQFYLSLEDDLMRLFGSDRIGRLMERLRMPDDMPIEHSLVSKSIEQAQRQVESQNFSARKHILEYDDVMNKQREVVYNERFKVLSKEDFHTKVDDILREVIQGAVDTYTTKENYPEEWDLEGLFTYINQLFPLSLKKESFNPKTLTQEGLFENFLKDAKDAYQEREKAIGSEVMRELEKRVMLEIIDNRWREHLYEMDYLQEGIGLRAVGQRDPLIEFKNEAFAMFQDMIASVKEDFVRYIFHVEVVEEPRRPRMRVVPVGEPSGQPAYLPRQSKKVGRNEPCPCGSGKKFKKCHGA
ncbi:MAG TPA: preprotein translocase subunit SecA [Candidatus Subteraquimicrobiales bacterium]